MARPPAGAGESRLRSDMADNSDSVISTIKPVELECKKYEIGFISFNSSRFFLFSRDLLIANEGFRLKLASISRFPVAPPSHDVRSLL
jgi:hypothetical protein